VGPVAAGPTADIPQPNPSPQGEGLKPPVTLAVIIGAHGVGGEVRLKSFAQNAASIKAHKSFNDGALTLQSLRDGNTIIARFAEIADRNTAERMRGTALTVPRAALPPLGEGEYYHTDIIGLPAVSDAGDDLGRVVAIENFGAGDVLEIERPPENGKPGKRFMVPMTAQAVPEWGTRVVIDAAFVE
jgi:16S rRNA processing protein RimM